jgi:hypothetical protein
LKAAETKTCSAALIKRGLVVTAAHCAANYGTNEFYSTFFFVPAFNDGTARYSMWMAASAKVLKAWLDGTDGCEQPGVICPDDVAILTLMPHLKGVHAGKFAGDLTGWFEYGLNGAGFTSASQALISELGYPALLDKGMLMERTDAQGSIVRVLSRNTVIGSLMTDGSDGGPWLLNLGVAPVLSGGIVHGRGAERNLVVGVTSWTSGTLTDKFVAKEQGASPFTDHNIKVLVDESCAATPAACENK